MVGESLDKVHDEPSLDSLPDIPNPGSNAAPYYTPLQTPPAGTALSANPPRLFQPLHIRSLTLQNRIFVSPMAQWSSDDGHATDWHVSHMGGMIVRGPGLSFVEATAVQPHGRTSPQDAGLWQDSQIPPLKRIVDFAHSQGQKVAIQLVHAGRKSSTAAPWIGIQSISTRAVGGWPDQISAPSAVAMPGLPAPRAMTLDDIATVKDAWAAATRRAVAAGFDAIEIHGAHGYLVHQFLSPIANQRTDAYGGSFENRTRFLLEIIDAMRQNMPDSMPLFLRVSATEWLDKVQPTWHSWTGDDTVSLAKLLRGKIDLIDVSTGGIHTAQQVEAAPVQISGREVSAYQAPFAIKVKEAVGDAMLVATVGSISDGHTAQHLLDQGLDAVFVGKQFLKNTGTVFQFADDLGVDVKMPHQISWVFRGRGKK